MKQKLGLLWKQNLIKRLESKPDNTGKEVIFETGYGPSGLPHIGTFGEVVRTSMIRYAFEILTGRKTRLICFSDDMNGLRKVQKMFQIKKSWLIFLICP